MSIWHSPPDIAEVNKLRGDSLAVHLDIVISEIADDYLVATMPVNERSVQPFGILHGGASVALAETLATVGAHLTVDPERFNVVGMEINANHLRSVSIGEQVTATARPIHRGRTTQVWQIDLVDEKDRPVCVSRMTASVLEIRDR